jgi:hypothetical protein
LEVAMGLLDKLKGSRPAVEGVPPVSIDDLRSSLLALNRDTAPWQVRDGAEDGCDLVAEWRIVDAQWSGVFFQYGLNKVFRVKLKFDERDHEVRNIDEQATVTWRDGIPSVSKSWSRGQINEIEVGQAYGFTEEGEFGQVYNYKFRSSEIKDPLRDAVTEHGWGWKAVSFRL